MSVELYAPATPGEVTEYETLESRSLERDRHLFLALDLDVSFSNGAYSLKKALEFDNDSDGGIEECEVGSITSWHDDNTTHSSRGSPRPVLDRQFALEQANTILLKQLAAKDGILTKLRNEILEYQKEQKMGYFVETNRNKSPSDTAYNDMLIRRLQQQLLQEVMLIDIS